MKTTKSSSRQRFLLAVTAALLGGNTTIALAAAGGPSNAPLADFAPPANDPALDILGQISGDVGGLGFFPGGLDANITSMFFTFNTAVIAVAAVFFMWNVLSATIQGAHDGEFLGKRYHSYWMPIRTFTGIFFLMPLFAGWSAAQVLMAWAAWGGTGIANHVAGASSSIVQMQTAQYVAMPPAPDMKPVIADLKELYANVITYKHAQLLRTMSGESASTDPFLGVNFTTTVTTTGETVRVTAGANPPAYGFGPESLGVFEYTISGADASYAKSQAIKTAYISAVQTVIRDANAEIKGYTDRLGTTDPYSTTFYAINGDFQAAAMTLPTRMQRQVVALLESARLTAQSLPTVTTNGSSFASSYGWIGAGLGIVDNTLISFEASSLSGKNTSVAGTAAKPDSAGTTKSALAAKDPAKLDAAATSVKNQAAADRRNATAAGKVGDWDGSGVGQELALSSDQVDANHERVEPSSSSIGADITNAVNDGMRKVVISFAAKVTKMMSAQTNPIAAMQNFGLGIVGIIGDIFALFLTVAAIGIGIATLTSILGGIGGVIGGLLSAFAFILMVVILPLAFFALKLVGILPFTPVIMWLGAVVNYFVIFIESLFGGQLWGLVHLDPDGEGMGQRTTHGYVFLLNLLFRPAMMVICLAFSYKLLGIAGGLGIQALGSVITQVTTNPANGWIMPLMMVIACIWVFVSLMESLIHTCMSLVNVVPGQVITWIGGTFGSNVGNDLDRGVQQGANSMASSTGSAGGQLAQGAVGTAGRKMSSVSARNTAEAQQTTKAQADEQKSQAKDAAKNAAADQRMDRLISAIRDPGNPGNPGGGISDGRKT